jgi:hypothetical protein
VGEHASQQERGHHVLGRCGKLSVVDSRRILDRGKDAVATLTSRRDVDLLEVERRLGKSISVCHVVHRVENVEGVGSRRIWVHSVARGDIRILSVVENKSGSGLDRGVSYCLVEIHDRVVAPSSELARNLH